MYNVRIEFRGMMGGGLAPHVYFCKVNVSYVRTFTPAI